MKEQQLPTESELRAELQSACDLINNGNNGFIALKVEIDKCLNQFWVMSKNFAVGNAHEFRPDPKPPAKNTIVQSLFGKLWFSTGKFADNGSLCTTVAPNGRGKCGSLDEWITLDRTQCSENWNHEWEKGWGL